MKEKYYCLLLDNYATPDFYCSTKAYYGTMADMQGVIRSLKRDRQNRARYAELICAFEDFEVGAYDVTHAVANGRVSLLIPAELLVQAPQVRENYRWEHLDVRGRPYQMRCDSVQSTHFWFIVNGRYVRCAKTVFEGLAYEDKSGEWRSTFGDFPRFRGMVEANKRLCFNRLAVEEKVFLNREQMEQDYAAFCLAKDVKLVDF